MREFLLIGRAVTALALSMFCASAVGGVDASSPRVVDVDPDPAEITNGSSLSVIDVIFSEDVVVPSGAISIRSTTSGTLAFSDAYDPASRRLTITLGQTVTVDQVTLVLDYSITDTAGNALDGEIGSPSAPVLPSGDGGRGGKAVVQWLIFAGDVNRDDSVDFLDLDLLLDQWGAPGEADLDGSGIVDFNDLGLLLDSWASPYPGDDGSAPEIASVTPDPAQPIETDLAEVSVTFTEPVDAATIAPDDLFVLGGDGLPRAASMLSSSPDGLSATFTFDPPLARCDAYRLRFSNAAADASGSLLLPPTPAPVIDGRVPSPVPTIDPVARLQTAPSVMIAGDAPGAMQARVIGPLGVEVVPVVNDRFEATLPLPENVVSTIFVSSISDCGRTSGSATVEVVRDTSSPFIVLDFPRVTSEIIAPAVTVVGRVGDEFAGVQGMTVSINGAPAQVDVGSGTNGTFILTNLPLTIGTQTLSITATDVLGNARTIMRDVTRLDPPPGTPLLTIESGDGQQAPALAELAQPLRVRLTRPDGQPLASKLVTFEVVRNDGLLAATPGATSSEGAARVQVFTDDLGFAEAVLRVGSTAGAGANRVEVTSRDLTGSAFFCATTTAGSPRRILVADANLNNRNTQAGAPTPRPLSALVTDGDAGNPVEGVPVTFNVVRNDGLFAGGASSVEAMTGADGRAFANFVTGETPGLNVVEATFPGNPGLPAVFTAVGIERIEGGPTSVAATVLDNANRPIGGAMAMLMVTLETPTGPEATLLGPVFSDVNGRIRFDSSLLPPEVLDDDIPGGPAKLKVDAVNATTLGGEPITRPWTFPFVGYDFVITENAENRLPDPVWLPMLDEANEFFYDGTEDVEVTMAGIDGLVFTVRAGSLTREDGSRPSPSDPEIIRLNQVHFDELPMPLPDGNAYPLAWTMAPKNARFDPPIEVQLPNMTGLSPNAVAEVLQWNNAMAEFQIMGTARVSEDGSTLASEPGSGITVAGWGGFAPPPPPPTEVKKCPEPTTNGCTTVADIWAFRCDTDANESESDAFNGLCNPTNCVTLNFADVACNAHDICYGTCGGPSKQDCDEDFLIDLLVACNGLSVGLPGSDSVECNALIRDECRAKAWLYYWGVVVFGGGPYSAAREHCEDCMMRADRIRDRVRRGDLVLPDPPYQDDDLDGMADEWEIEQGLDPTNPIDATVDYDGDLLPSIDEFAVGADPNNAFSLDPTVPDGEYVWARQPPRPVVFDELWAVRVSGQETPVSAAGSFVIQVPRNGQLVRVKGEALRQGQRYYFASNYFELDGPQVDIVETTIRDTPFPSLIDASINASQTLLLPGEASQLLVSAATSAGGLEDITPQAKGTTYASSNGSVLSVSSAGDVTAITQGTAFITASNEGVTAVRRIEVVPDLVTTTIAGVVLDADGVPVEDALVTTATRFGGLGFTDDRGRFSFDVNLLDAVDLRVRATTFTDDGLLLGVSDRVPTLIDGITDAGLVTVRLVPPGPIYGNPEFDALDRAAGLAAGDFDQDGDVDLVTGSEQGTQIRVHFNIDAADFASDLTLNASYQRPEHVLAADFSGDGVPDIASTHFDSNRLRVLRSNADGTFSFVSDIPMGQRPRGLAAGDVDGDNDLDLLAANSLDGTVFVFLNNGSGGFATTPNFTVATAAGPRELRLSDIDMDGDDDLLVLAEFGRGVAVHVSDGVTGFGAPTLYDVGGLPRGITVGEFDGAPGDDIAVTDFLTDSVVLLLNDGAGGFAPGGALPVGDGPSGLASGDVDGDGATDIVAANTLDGTATVLLAQGGGAFLAETFNLGAGVRDIVLADLDLDMDLDIAATNTIADTVGVLLNDGGGVFADDEVYPALASPRGLASADMNDDDWRDLIVTGRDADAVAVLFGDGAGFTLGPATTVGDAPEGVAVSDLNGDGEPDVVVANGGSDTVTVLFSNAAGALSVNATIPVGDRPTAVTLTDLDGDGDRDLLVANTSDDTVTVLLNAGGAFAEVDVIATAGQPRAIAAADLDASGDIDIAVVCAESSVLQVFMGDGAGGFSAATTYASPNGPVDVIAADVDGDNGVDLVAPSVGADVLSIYLNDLAGGFADRRELPLAGNAESVRADDIDFDGAPDLVLARSDSGGVAILLNGEGDVIGEFRAPLNSGVGDLPTAVVIDDFNEDGDLDIAAANAEDDTISVLRNRRVPSEDLRSTYGGRRLVRVSPRPVEVTVGDDAVATPETIARMGAPAPLNAAAGARPNASSPRLVLNATTLRVTRGDAAASGSPAEDGAAEGTTSIDPAASAAMSATGDLIGTRVNDAGFERGYVVPAATARLVEIGTLGGDVSRATGVLTGPVVLGQATDASGQMHAIAWTSEVGAFRLASIVEAPEGLSFINVREARGDGRLLIDAVDASGDPWTVEATLSVTERLAADLTSDGVVDMADVREALELIRDGDPAADLNGDGRFDLADMNMVLDAYGATVSTTTPANR